MEFKGVKGIEDVFRFKGSRVRDLGYLGWRLSSGSSVSGSRLRFGVEGVAGFLLRMQNRLKPYGNASNRVLYTHQSSSAV